MFSGNLSRDRVEVNQLAVNFDLDWPGTFAVPQTNTYALGNDPKAALVPMKEIGGVRSQAVAALTGSPAGELAPARVR